MLLSRAGVLNRMQMRLIRAQLAVTNNITDLDYRDCKSYCKLIGTTCFLYQWSYLGIYRWNPAKRALPAMLTHGWWGPFGRIPSILAFLLYRNRDIQHRLLITFLMEDKDLSILHSQYHDNWCSADAYRPGHQHLVARFMGPTWGLPGADRTQVGPMLAPWSLLSGHPCYWRRITGLVHERCNSSALAMELCLTCTNPSVHSNDLIACFNTRRFKWKVLLWNVLTMNALTLWHKPLVHDYI